MTRDLTDLFGGRPPEGKAKVSDPIRTIESALALAKMTDEQFDARRGGEDITRTQAIQRALNLASEYYDL